MAAIEARLKEEFGGELPGGHSVGWSTTAGSQRSEEGSQPGGKPGLGRAAIPMAP